MKLYDLQDRRRSLDERLRQMNSAIPTPSGGWVRNIRESLGMTLEAFGRRIGVSRATALQIERAEVNESITVKRLRSAANALGCDLSIQFVPRQSLDSMVQDRAYKIALEEFEWVNHTMVLENQAVYDKSRNEMIEKLKQDIIEQKDSRIWNSE